MEIRNANPINCFSFSEGEANLILHEIESTLVLNSTETGFSVSAVLGREQGYASVERAYESGRITIKSLLCIAYEVGVMLSGEEGEMLPSPWKYNEDRQLSLAV